MKKVWKLLKNLKLEFSYDSARPVLRLFPKECKLGYIKDTFTPMFITALFTIAKL
jgi:hypothetical protein